MNTGPGVSAVQRAEGFQPNVVEKVKKRKHHEHSAGGFHASPSEGKEQNCGEELPSLRAGVPVGSGLGDEDERILSGLYLLGSPETCLIGNQKYTSREAWG